jgi:hypothetical protein
MAIAILYTITNILIRIAWFECGGIGVKKGKDKNNRIVYLYDLSR